MSLDANEVALAKYEREQAKAEELWERVTQQLDDMYGDVLDEIFNTINSISDETGFNSSELFDDLMER